MKNIFSHNTSNKRRAKWDDHLKCEFQTHDVETTMKTMVKVLKQYIPPAAKQLQTPQSSQSPLQSSSIQVTAERQKMIIQALADKQLLDRIFPEVI